MKKYYAYLSAAAVVLTSLSSCSRSDYAFKPAASGYHASTVVSNSAPDPAKTVAAITPIEKPAAPTAAAIKPVTVAIPQKKRVSIAKAQTVASLAPLTEASALQKKVVNRIVKQVEKKNIASTTQAQSEAGRSALIALAGLLLILLGGLTGIGIIATIGGIAFLVGLILLIINLIKGK